MKLKIVQAGHPALHCRARELTVEEIRSEEIQQLIESMKETLDEVGVGLAAPQIGESLQIAVIEDKIKYIERLPPERAKERERVPVPLHVIINPVLTIETEETVEFFEGCLSVAGFVGLTPRARSVKVECLNEKAEPVTIRATGWYARILQHEIGHLNGQLYIERIVPQTLMTTENYMEYWFDKKYH